jgi:hypothetical protein
LRILGEAPPTFTSKEVPTILREMLHPEFFTSEIKNFTKDPKFC